MKMIEDFKSCRVRDLATVESLGNAMETGLYSLGGFMIEDYSAETGIKGSTLMQSKIAYGIIGPDRNFTENELSEFRNNPKILTADMIMLDFSYYVGTGELSFNNIKKLEKTLRELGFCDLHSYSNRLAWYRRTDRFYVVKLTSYLPEIEVCVVSARCARAVLSILTTGFNHVSDHFHSELAEVDWRIVEEAVDFDHMKMHAVINQEAVEAEISPLRIPDGRPGYSIGYLGA